MRAVWWWVDRWRKSTAYTDMTLAEQGAYRNLLDELWLRDGILPDSERILAKISGDALEWGKVRKAVLAHFEKTDAGWINKTHDEVMAQSKRRAKNQKTYRDRRDANVTDNVIGNSRSNVDAIEPASPSPSPSQEPEQSPKGESPLPPSGDGGGSSKLGPGKAKPWEVALEALGLEGRGFEAPCSEWAAYRREAKRAAWKLTTWKAKLKESSDPEAFQAAVRFSIGNGYQGLIEPKQNGQLDKRSKDDAIFAREMEKAAEMSRTGELPKFFS